MQGTALHMHFKPDAAASISRWPHSSKLFEQSCSTTLALLGVVSTSCTATESTFLLAGLLWHEHLSTEKSKCCSSIPGVRCFLSCSPLHKRVRLDIGAWQFSGGYPLDVAGGTERSSFCLCFGVAFDFALPTYHLWKEGRLCHQLNFPQDRVAAQRWQSWELVWQVCRRSSFRQRDQASSREGIISHA